MHDTHPLRELTQRREEREAEGAEYESAEGERERESELAPKASRRCVTATLLYLDKDLSHRRSQPDIVRL